MTRGRSTDAGVSLVEVLIVCAVLAGMAAWTAVPAASIGDGTRVRQAASYLVAALEDARALAVARSAPVGLVFGADAAGTPFAVHVDGNGNGVRTAEAASGADPAIRGAVILSVRFPGVRIADGDQSGVRLGASRVLSFSPAGTATPGSIILTGPRGGRYAIRVTGGSARLRLQRFNPASGVWSDR